MESTSTSFIMTRSLLLFAIILASCSEEPGRKLSEVNKRLRSSHLYWTCVWTFIHRISFQEYVELLRKKSYEHYSLTIGIKAKANWVTESDLTYLMTLIESKADAYCVRSVYADWKAGSDDHSSLGGQVMNIIDAYRKNEPYPNFLYDCPVTDSTRVQEIKKWWNDREN